MRAVILAAGQGSRLFPLTKNTPKPLVKIFGRPIFEQQIENLNAAGVGICHVITGYESERFDSYEVPKFRNQDYMNSNMVWSMYCAKALLDGSEDLILCYGDILTEPQIIRQLVENEAEISVCSDLSWHEYWSLRMEQIFDDVESFEVDIKNNIIRLGDPVTCPELVQGQFIGLIKLRKDIQHKVLRVYESEIEENAEQARNMYFTDFLNNLIEAGVIVKAVPHHRGWLEIDSVEDLRCYEELYKTNKSKLGYNPKSIKE